jgi:hypothetical protein
MPALLSCEVNVHSKLSRSDLRLVAEWIKSEKRIGNRKLAAIVELLLESFEAANQ